MSACPPAAARPVHRAAGESKRGRSVRGPLPGKFSKGDLRNERTSSQQERAYTSPRIAKSGSLLSDLLTNTGRSNSLREQLPFTMSGPGRHTRKQYVFPSAWCQPVPLELLRAGSQHGACPCVESPIRWQHRMGLLLSLQRLGNHVESRRHNLLQARRDLGGHGRYCLARGRA